MSKIVDLKEYRNKLIEQKAFGPWRKRFGESYGVQTKVSDLSDSTLYFLARPKEETAVAFYEVIMGVLSLGKALKFYYLDRKDQLLVVDIHLLLGDQVRLELMRRLGWLNSFPGQDYTLVEMVQDFDTIKAEIGKKPAALSPSHPDFDVFNELTTSEDKQVLIRRMLLKALEEFRARLAN
jgi:hypothetical protein